MLSVSEFSSQICLAVKRYILNSSSSLIFKVVSLCEGFNILEKKDFIQIQILETITSKSYYIYLL